MANRAYDLVRSLVEDLGGTMFWERQGHPHGAWVIRVRDRDLVVEARGDRSFPMLDRLYVPRTADPKAWDDYANELLPDAERRLRTLLQYAARMARLSPAEAQQITGIIARAKWRFSWTMAYTYPHEYTTRTRCPADDHAELIDLIERHGFCERFSKAYRKYLYFEDRKFWHMGDPSSEDPEQHPNVINRCWLDVRRHAENVKHVWTPEEVQLQQRLWEIRQARACDLPDPL